MKIKDEMFIIDERIRKENIKLKVKILEKNKEIERLNNIIEEAKEYIESRARKAGVELMPREIELLEILNKGE